MDHLGGHTSGESFGYGSGERSPDDRWLSYDEISRIRGIGRESAVKLVRRKRWPRRPGNDGTARALIPVDWLTPAKALSERFPEPSPDAGHAIDGLESAIGAIREQQEAERGVWREASTRLEQAVAAERARADAAESRADAAIARAERAEDRAADADAAREGPRRAQTLSSG